MPSSDPCAGTGRLRGTCPEPARSGGGCRPAEHRAPGRTAPCLVGAGELPRLHPYSLPPPHRPKLLGAGDWRRPKMCHQRHFCSNFFTVLFGREWAGALISVSSPVCEGQGRVGLKGTNGNTKERTKLLSKSSPGWEEKVGELSSVHI